MKQCNQMLATCYGTEHVFSKTAGEVPTAVERLIMGLLNFTLAKKNQDLDERARVEDVLRHEAARELEHAQMQQATSSLQHTHAPRLLPAGSDLPVGWDEGMVRLASIAASVGADLAKEAGIGDLALSTLGSGAKLLKPLALPAAAVGTGVAAIGAGRAIARKGQEEPQTPVYGMGHPVRGVGYQLPFGVNQWGQPQVGTSL